MSTFNPGDNVLLLEGGGFIGTVRKSSGGGWIVHFGSDGPGAWLVTESIVRIPDGVPVLHVGDRARVRCDAPRSAGQAGTVNAPEFIADVFGYWLVLDVSFAKVWIPAAALTPENGGGAAR